MRADSTDYIFEDKLLDGRSIAIRAIHPDDRVNLQDIWQHLSEQSKYYRFFVPKKELSDKELAYYSEIDFRNHVGLLAIVIENGVQVPVGVGRYIVSGESEDRRVAEVALTVEDDYHGLGIGTLLLTHLTEIARAKGIEEFRAFVLTENRKMREVFQHCGLPMKASLGLSGVLEIRLALT
jgi:GNAT superfamily N-acetyltransferase